ncbi:stage II sporulation protein M [Natrialbaceae archaeon A-arb3/5]
MNGAGDDADGDGTDTRTDRGGSEERDESGGFEFGPDQEPVQDEEQPRSEGASDADSERRIRVDLPDSDETDGTETPTGQPGPPGGSGPPEPGPDPRPNAARNWSLLLFGLALVSLATAAVTVSVHDSTTAAAGATVLALAFAVLGIVSLSVTPRLATLLDAAWLEHRRYTWFATGLFAFGIAIGVVLLFAGVNLLELIVELLDEGLFPELEDEDFELTATFFITHNTQPFLMSIAGALTLGVFTAIIMVFNGLIVGNLSAAMGGTIGLDYVVIGLAPHGIFELAALFIASGVGFRFVYRFGERVVGRREAFLTKPYIYRTLALVAFAWLLLVLAAFVEAYITPELLEMLFAERLAELEQEAQTPSP